MSILIVRTIKVNLFTAFLLSMIFTVDAKQNTANVKTNVNTSSNVNGSTAASTQTTGLANPADATQTTTVKPKKAPCPTPDQLAAEVEDVFKVNKDGSVTRDNIELGDVIVVKINNLQTLLDEADCLDKPRNVVLYLDDKPLKNATAFPPTAPQESVLKFTLTRNEDSRNVWTHILGRPSLGSRPVKVSVGLEDKYPVKSDSWINLIVIPINWFAFWLFIFLVILGAFLWLAIKTSLLRDPVTPENGGKRTFSLGRSQAAWWFFIIIASYLFIGMITGDFSTTITGTVLTLFGISAGTAIGSAVVDVSKNTAAEVQNQTSASLNLKAEIETLKQEIQNIETDISNAQADLTQDPNNVQAKEVLVSAKQLLAAKKAEMADKLSQLNKLKNHSENFLIDILSDINGISFHRFQVAAITIVLGIIFIVQVYKVLAMPTFDGTLLALLGISAGTYLGFKIPESTVPPK